MRGAEPHDLQIDITRAEEDRRQCIRGRTRPDRRQQLQHPSVGGRLLFRQEENARAKLLSYAKNNKLFREGEHAGKDIEHLAEVIQNVLGGDTRSQPSNRVLMLKTHWQSDPWSDFDERYHPKTWDDKRLNILVLPSIRTN